MEGDRSDKKKFKTYPIGYFHIDIAEVQTAEGKLYLYVAIDRTSKFAFVQFVRKTGRSSASTFLVALIAAVPYKIHTVLTDNGVQFTFPPRYADRQPNDLSRVADQFFRVGGAQNAHPVTDLARRHELDQEPHFAFARRAPGQVLQIFEQLVFVGEAAGRVDATDRVLQLDLRHDHGGEIDQDMLLVLAHPAWLIVCAERAKPVAAGIKPDTSASRRSP